MPVHSRERALGGPVVDTPPHPQHLAPRPAHPHHNNNINCTSTTTATPHSTAAPRDSPDTIHVLPRVFGIGAHGSHVAPGQNEDELHGQPAKKKRKLSIRTANHKLESFGFSAQPRLSSQTTNTTREPPGSTQHTINGLTRSLEEEELSRQPSPGRMPQRVVRLPAAEPLPPPPLPLAASPGKQREKRKKEDRRSLRSHDEGPRLKSELALYFPNYEDVMFDVPLAEEEDFLTVDSSLYIAEDTAKKKDGEPSPVKSKKGTPLKGLVNGTNGPLGTSSRKASAMSNAGPTVTLDFLVMTSGDAPEDPLADAHFLKSHNRAERKEKQVRNIERERAMHEKVQLERLLDGLQGHDWLKVLGITGVTDGEAKKYDKKRDYFISEVQALIDKFAQWKEQEKRLRLRKEAAQAKLDGATDEDDRTSSSVEPVEPRSSDLNASAARQLQQETANALRASSSSKLKGKAPLHHNTTSTPTSVPNLHRFMIPPPFHPPSPEIPITSFYAKRHLRDAALSKSRLTTRNVTAFGHPVPDLPEQEFALPGELITPDALRASARERRRRKRESAANAGKRGTSGGG